MNTQQNTFGVVFYLRRYKTSREGKTPIYARITVNGKRSDIAVKRSIAENNWNAKKGLAKGSKSEITQLNNYLEKFRSVIVESYQSLLLEKKIVTANLIKNKFLGRDQQVYTIRKLIDYHNQKEKDNLEWGTMKNYYTTQKYITTFLKERQGTNDKYLSELNYKFITDLETYLRHVKDKNGVIAMGNNGVMKHLERFCKMINLAVKLEWIDRNPFHAYQLKFEKVERQFLNTSELAKLELKQIPILRLQTIKDLFIFSCYTGLAYIDVFNLRPSHITEVSEGDFWIKTIRQKTNTMVTVPLLPKALAIIEKYKEHPQSVAEGKVLPVVSNQKMNGYLKEIADICGITKPLSFHIARHTFATTVTLTNGVPIESISKMLGHTKLSTTQIYAKVVESKLAGDMARLRDRLEVNDGNLPQ
ncbi:MAG: site-specific integrase [Pedobacter sp.]|nr:site-specific integrase [Pedobacter sp.]